MGSTKAAICADIRAMSAAVTFVVSTFFIYFATPTAATELFTAGSFEFLVFRAALITSLIFED